jgi:hypothetical protein
MLHNSRMTSHKLVAGTKPPLIPVQNDSLKYGYARVPTDGQSLDAHVRQLFEAGRRPGARLRRGRRKLVVTFFIALIQIKAPHWLLSIP